MLPHIHPLCPPSHVTNNNMMTVHRTWRGWTSNFRAGVKKWRQGKRRKGTDERTARETALIYARPYAKPLTIIVAPTGGEACPWYNVGHGQSSTDRQESFSKPFSPTLFIISCQRASTAEDSAATNTLQIPSPVPISIRHDSRLLVA